MDLKTSFKILEIGSGTDETLAKRAYKAQVRRWHPDQFPAGSNTKAEAEEQLKLINIAYAFVKAYLARRQPAPPNAGTTAAHPPRFGRDTADRPGTPGKKPKRHRWVDHLFDTLNAFAGYRNEDSISPPADDNDANRRKTFEQVLDELAGGSVSPDQKRQTGHAVNTRHGNDSGYRRYGRRGGRVSTVGGTEAPGPVKPVARVRGIGRNR